MLMAAMAFALIQEIPATVAGEQLSAALEAPVEGSGGAAGMAGASAPLMLLLFVMLSLLVAMAWITRRRRPEPAMGPPAGDAAAQRVGDDGRTGAQRPQQPQETLALPPHVLAILAKQGQASGEEAGPAPPVDAGADEVSPVDEPGRKHSTSASGLDILLGR